MLKSGNRPLRIQSTDLYLTKKSTLNLEINYQATTHQEVCMFTNMLNELSFLELFYLPADMT